MGALRVVLVALFQCLLSWCCCSGEGEKGLATTDTCTLSKRLSLLPACLKRLQKAKTHRQTGTPSLLQQDSLCIRICYHSVVVKGAILSYLQEPWP